jgi:hypothetical protein
MIDFNAHFDAGPPVEATASQSALQWLAENAVEDELPGDLSAKHDPYLYRTPKRG